MSRSDGGRAKRRRSSSAEVDLTACGDWCITVFSSASYTFWRCRAGHSRSSSSGRGSDAGGVCARACERDGSCPRDRPMALFGREGSRRRCGALTSTLGLRAVLAGAFQRSTMSCPCPDHSSAVTEATGTRC
eukprot:scaffold9726_cov119-Isochrysis_galbana.AAC.29